ncbi:MAG: ATP-binding protein [Elusimicrobiota bacterium]
MEKKIINIFENKLEEFKNKEFTSKLQETEEFNLLIDYWREIVVRGLNERENLLREMIKDKDERIGELNAQVNALKQELKRLREKKAELDNKIKMQELRLENEKLILESSYKEKFRDKIRSLEEEYREKEMLIERMKMEKTNFEERLNQAEKQLKTKESEFLSYKKNVEENLKEKKERIENLRKTKKELKDSIDLISQAKLNTWVRDIRSGQKLNQVTNIPNNTPQQQETVQQQNVPANQIADTKEIEKLKNKLEKLKEEKEEAETKYRQQKERAEKVKQEADNEIQEIRNSVDKRIREAVENKEKTTRSSPEDMAQGFAYRLRNIFGIVGGIAQLCTADFEEMKGKSKKGKGLFGFGKKGNEELDEKRKEMIENLNAITQNIKLAQKATNDFLQIARKQSLNIQPMNVNDIIKEVCEEFRDKCRESGIEMKIELDEKDAELMLDKERICESLHHVILNAVEAMPKGGTLTVKSTFLEDKEKYKIEIIDTGEGVSEQRKGRIFQMFCSSKKGRKGIGLPTARRYIEVHLGSLDFETEKGRGSKVTIVLPTYTNIEGQQEEQKDESAGKKEEESEKEKKPQKRESESNEKKETENEEDSEKTEDKQELSQEKETAENKQDQEEKKENLEDKDNKEK